MLPGSWGGGIGLLYDLHVELYASHGTTLPNTMRDMLVFFSPEGACPDDTSHSITRNPEVTRPLALCDSDAKIMSLAFGSPLARLAERTVHGGQRGGVKGRHISSNIVIADRRGVQQSLGGAPYSLQLLTDFAAAFPSIHI
eukprot:7848753-Pyramimonas_sp.AAC.1